MSGCTRSSRSTGASASTRPSCRHSMMRRSSPRRGRRDEPPFGRSYADYHDGFDGRAGARTWSPWYRDYMTGRLRAYPAARLRRRRGLRASPIGLTPDRWARRAS